MCLLSSFQLALLPRINACSRAVVSLIEQSILLQFLQRLTGLVHAGKAKSNKCSLPYGVELYVKLQCCHGSRSIYCTLRECGQR